MIGVLSDAIKPCVTNGMLDGNEKIDLECVYFLANSISGNTGEKLWWLARHSSAFASSRRPHRTPSAHIFTTLHTHP